MRVGFTLGLIFTAASGLTQELPARHSLMAGSGPVLRVDTNLVLVPVTVTDNRGGVVPNLTESDFILSEEKQRQQIVSFSHEIAPVSLGIVVDLSGSMASKIAKVHVAVGALLDNLESEDEAFLVTFADRPELRLPFTSDISTIRSALALAQPEGSTALFDAVALAVHQMRSAQNRRRVLFLISDGGDNHSRLTEGDLRRLLDEEDVQIHAIGIHDNMRGWEEMRGPRVLEDLASMTGGQHHMVNNIAELPDLASRMSLALHDRYLLGYKPAPPGLSGTFRKIDVKLALPKGKPRLYVYARRGYRMP